MTALAFEEVADGIFCIETGLYRSGLAACYLVRSGDRLAFVDTGTARTVPGLLAVIDALGHTPSQVDYVIPTHVHLDHAGGAGALMAACPGARLLVHPKGAPHMIDPSKLVTGATAVYGAAAFANHFGTLTPIPEERVTLGEDGSTYALGDRPLVFIDTPGHANHHGCIYDARTGCCFSGDTFGISYRDFDATGMAPMLFAPTTPVAFDPEAWEASLDKLMGYAPRAMLLTHYGRLERPEALVDGLRRSIEAHAAIGLEEEGRDGEGRTERLMEAVGALLIGEARRHRTDLDEATAYALLAVDIALNAQGLAVWLARRARQAAERG